MADPYVLLHTIDTTHTINCLSFSPTGKYFASGSEDSTIRIWNPTIGNLLHEIILQSPIICLEWDPLLSTRLFYGCQNGVVAYIDGFIEGKAHRIQTGLENGQVYALAIDETSVYVAISIGPEIHIAKKLTNGSYATVSILPAPKPLPNTTDKSDGRIRGRALKFTKRGRRLIVSYLNHGIVCWDTKEITVLWSIAPSHRNRHIGSSALSPDGRSFLTSNLDNGMNLYSLETFTVLRSYQYNVNPETNFPLSVAFIKKGKYVVCGTHTCNVSIWETSTGEVLQTLDHNAPLVKCLTVQTVNGYEFIVTATGQKRSEVKIWKAPISETFQDQVIDTWKYTAIWFRENIGIKTVQDVAVVISFFLGMYYLVSFFLSAPQDIQSPPKAGPSKFGGFLHSTWAIIRPIFDLTILMICYLYDVIAGWRIAFVNWLKHVILEWLDIERTGFGDSDTVRQVTESAIAQVDSNSETASVILEAVGGRGHGSPTVTLLESITLTVKETLSVVLEGAGNVGQGPSAATVLEGIISDI